MPQSVVKSGQPDHYTKAGRTSDANDAQVFPKTEERDRTGLMQIGKVPVLKRSYNFLSITGFTVTILVTWESSLGYVFSSEQQTCFSVVLDTDRPPQHHEPGFV